MDDSEDEFPTVSQVADRDLSMAALTLALGTLWAEEILQGVPAK